MVRVSFDELRSPNSRIIIIHNCNNYLIKVAAASEQKGRTEAVAPVRRHSRRREAALGMRVATRDDAPAECS